MSVVLNFNYIVLRKSEIETRYPGGLQSFRTEWIPESLGNEVKEDQHLISLITMGGGLDSLGEKLWETGLLVEGKLSSTAVFVGTDVCGYGTGCGWLEFGEEEGFLVCWLRGGDRGSLAYDYMK
jgi:hypothetical protein